MPKSLHYSQLKELVERHDENGERIPFAISYACLNGAVVNITERCMICIGVDLRHRRRTIKSLTSGDIRTIHDCLVLSVNDTEIIVS